MAPPRRALLLVLAAAVALAVAVPVAWSFATRSGAQPSAAATAGTGSTQTGDTSTGAAEATLREPAPVTATPAPTAPDVPRRDASQTGTARPAAAPTRVIIESAQIDAEVLPVGVADDGQMDLPPNPDQVGWYRFGPAPGEAAGSAVMAAHVDSRRYGIGQFARLERVRAGDRVEATLADGTRLTYEVVEVEVLRKTAVPLETLFARDGDPRLVLVTCGGRFDRDARRYEDNVIVTAVPADPGSR